MEIQRDTNEILAAQAMLSLSHPDFSLVPKIDAMSTPKKANRRFKKPQKLVVSANMVAALKNVVKEEEKNKDDIDALALNEKENLTFQAKRLTNFLAASSSHSWIWYEFSDSFVDLCIQRGYYDLRTYLKEYYPRLNSHLLPRRVWQLLRRKLGKARLFSPAFIKLELEEMKHSRNLVRQLQQANPIEPVDHPFLLKIHNAVPMPLAPNTKVSTLIPGKGIVSGVVASFHPMDSTYTVICGLNGNQEVFRIRDYIIQSAENFVGLPIANLFKSIDPNEKMFKTQIPMDKGGYSKKILQALVQLMKLVDIKKKAVQEIAKNIDSFEEAPNSLNNLSSTLQCSVLDLFRLNKDVLAAMSVLNEYGGVVVAHAFERYFKCCHQAELDLNNAGKYNSLNNMCHIGESGSPNGDQMREILKPFHQQLLEESRENLGQPVSPISSSIGDDESDV